ncbi:MAG: hypothetical protein AAF664_01610 [Planctomycetota bacterium]
MRFVFEGTPPDQKQLRVLQGLIVPAGPLIDERLIVDPKSKGIRNVIVRVHTGIRGSKLEPKPHEGTRKKIVLSNYRFEPHVLLAQVGDTLEVINQDPVFHKPAFNFFNNEPKVFDMPAGHKNAVALSRVEPGAVSIADNIFPWMKAYVVVSEHPYAAVSDKDGNIQIDGLPAGRDLVFRAIHESARFGNVIVAGRAEAWRGGRFKIHLEAGENDLGEVVIPKQAFN